MDILKLLFPVIIFMSLIGTIATFQAQGVGNTSGATAILLGLTTLFIAIVFIKYISKGAKGGR